MELLDMIADLADEPTGQALLEYQEWLISTATDEQQLADWEAARVEEELWKMQTKRSKE
jgi:hypothetical protein